MDTEPQASARGAHFVQKLVPRKASRDLLDRCSPRHDREHCRTAPGQAWLLQARCAQPCAQRRELVPAASEKSFESIASSHERKCCNTFSRKPRRESLLLFPKCQVLSDHVMCCICVTCRYLPFGHRHNRMQGRRQYQSSEN